MAIRIRNDGRVLCAALHGQEPGDLYLDDGIHYRLSVELKVLVTTPFESHMQHGQWWWANQVPLDVEIDQFYLEGVGPQP